MCAAKESRRVWKALNFWRRLQFMKRSPTDTLLHCSSSRWLILVMLNRICVCFALRAAAFGVGYLNIGSTTANAINFDFRRLVNIDDDHWDRARLSVTVLVGFGVCALHLRVDKSCVCAPFWLAVGGLAGARREAQVGHRMISNHVSSWSLHGEVHIVKDIFWNWRATTGNEFSTKTQRQLWSLWFVHSCGRAFTLGSLISSY